MKTNASRATLFEVWAAHPVVALLTALLGALTAAAVSGSRPCAEPARRSASASTIAFVILSCSTKISASEPS